MLALNGELVVLKNSTSIAFNSVSNPYDVTYPEWTIMWWRWIMAFPRSCNPAFDLSGSECAKDQNNMNVWFLAGTVMPLSSANRECVIPQGKAILLPIINNLVSYIEYPDLKSDNQLRAVAGRDYRLGVEFHLAIDGLVLSHEICRIATSPFEIEYPDGNLFGAKPGFTRAVSDGFWIFLTPLSQGMHSLYFSARDIKYLTEVNYTIHIE